jgi:hypothetical protein
MSRHRNIDLWCVCPVDLQSAGVCLQRRKSRAGHTGYKPMFRISPPQGSIEKGVRVP